MLLSTLGASLLGNLLLGKGTVRDGYGSSIKKKENICLKRYKMKKMEHM